MRNIIPPCPYDRWWGLEEKGLNFPHWLSHVAHQSAPTSFRKVPKKEEKKLFFLQIVWNQKVWCLLWLLNVLELCSLMWRRQRKRRRRQREVQEALCGNTMPGDSFLSWWKREIFIKNTLALPPWLSDTLEKFSTCPFWEEIFQSIVGLTVKVGVSV